MSFSERWIREFNNSKPLHSKIHVIKSLTYFEATSWGGFFSYKNLRHHIVPWEHFFKDFREEDLRNMEEVNKKMVQRGYEEIPYTYEWIEHENLYAFYDYVGYNRKTKKFER